MRTDATRMGSTRGRMRKGHHRHGSRVTRGRPATLWWYITGCSSTRPLPSGQGSCPRPSITDLRAARHGRRPQLLLAFLLPRPALHRQGRRLVRGPGRHHQDRRCPRSRRDASRRRRDEAHWRPAAPSSCHPRRGRGHAGGGQHDAACQARRTGRCPAGQHCADGLGSQAARRPQGPAQGKDDDDEADLFVPLEFALVSDASAMPVPTPALTKDMAALLRAYSLDRTLGLAILPSNTDEAGLEQTFGRANVLPAGLLAAGDAKTVEVMWTMCRPGMQRGCRQRCVQRCMGGVYTNHFQYHPISEHVTDS